MKGKTFILFVGILLLLFTLILFNELFSNGWFDLFLKGGFKAVHGD